MKAFHGDESIKAKYLARVAAHVAADQLVQGIAWDEDAKKGCAVGCTLEAYEHRRYETELGIPEHLAQLEDAIFEGLTVKESRSWPGQFLEAARVGADLSMVWPQFAHWMLTVELKPHLNDAVRPAVARVAALYFRQISGEKVGGPEWSAADSAAWSAARSAAESAESAESAARSAWSAARSGSAWSAARSGSAESAWSAAESAESAARSGSAWSAARSAAESAESAESAARSAWSRMAMKLLELIREAI